MSKLNPKIKNQIDRIDAKIDHINAQYDQDVAQLYKSYNIDAIADLDEEEQYKSSDMNNYLSWLGEISATHEIRRSKLYAERAAKMLIGYNIAHRGKKLHEKTVLKRTAKLGPDGEFIRDQMKNSVFSCPFVTTLPYLHVALARYGVILLDSNYLKLIMGRMTSLLAARDVDGYPPYEQTRTNNKIAKYETLTHLFHTQLIKQTMMRRSQIEQNRTRPF